MLRAVILFVAATACAFAADLQTITPREDPDVVLHNPDMGWVLYENYPLDPRPNGTGTMNTLPDAVFEGCDYVAVMFAWSDVEKEEGRFDWTLVDRAWDYWQQRRKGIHMRISTEPLFGWSRQDPPGGMGVPDWLLARIPEDQKARREDGAMFGWHVDARNALYQERLRIFLKEANAHFQGKRAPVPVDLRGFGRWGEWHTGFPYASLEQKREALDAVLQIWSESFPDRTLALSYSYDPDGPDELHAGPRDKFDPKFTGTYQQYLEYSAFDLALKYPNISLRRDGAGGAVSSNERKLCDFVYRELKRAPQASEFMTTYTQARSGGPAWLRWTVDDALSLHPNYVCLLGYSARPALDFMLERPDLVAHGLRRMGYRLVPTKVSLPTEIKAGEPFTIKMTWINRGAGRALRDFTLRLRLVDAKGAVLARSDAGVLPTSEWLEGDSHEVSLTAVFPSIEGRSTTATLFTSLYDSATGRTITLPMVKRTADEFVELGTVALSR